MRLAIVLILVFLPHHHASVSSVFTSRVNNTGFFGGKTGGLGFLFIVLPIGALLTQYTITGYDASAHLSEETHSAANSAAKGIWRSIVYSAIGGWLLLLAFLFAVQNPGKVTAAGGGVATIFAQALTSRWGGTVLLIATVGQFFCTMACMTSCTADALRLQPRRRRARPPGLVEAQRQAGARRRRHPRRRRLHHHHRAGPDPGRHRRRAHRRSPSSPSCRSASSASTGASPSRSGTGGAWATASSPAAGTSGPKYKVLSVVALLDVVLVTFMAFMPTSNLGVPWTTGFAWKYVNYTILVFPAFLIFLWIYWHVSVKNWFTGPKQHDRARDQRAARARLPRLVAALSSPDRLRR